MVQVSILYCVPCRFRAKAEEDADAIRKAFGDELDAVRIVPGDHGVYDVAVDGDPIFSLDEERAGFPPAEELIRRIRARIRGA